MSSEEEKSFNVFVERLENFVFKVDFDQEGVDDLIMDEPPPVGEGKGPNASNILAGAMGNCLSASLLFCLQKARAKVNDMKAEVHGKIRRNDEGRWRIMSMNVKIFVDIDQGYKKQMERCLGLFEDFCIASQSIEEGIPIQVSVDWD